MSLPPILQALFAETPGLQAAMRAGRKTSISVTVLRGCRDCPPCRGEVLTDTGGRVPCLRPRVEPLGVVSAVETAWKAHLRAWLGSGRRVVVRYVYRGREIERANY